MLKRIAVPAILVTIIPVIVTLLTALGVDLTPVLQNVCPKSVTVESAE